MLRTFVLIHHHKYGVDTRTFMVEDGLSETLMVPSEEKLADLLGLDYEPGKGETIDVAELYDFERYHLYKDEKGKWQADVRKDMA